MSHYPECNCVGCRANAAAARLNAAIASAQAETSRYNNINSTKITNEFQANLWIELTERLTRSIDRHAALISAAIDQFEAARGRSE